MKIVLSENEARVAIVEYLKTKQNIALSVDQLRLGSQVIVKKQIGEEIVTKPLNELHLLVDMKK